jgi:hypothetical protein
LCCGRCPARRSDRHRRRPPTNGAPPRGRPVCLCGPFRLSVAVRICSYSSGRR